MENGFWYRYFLVCNQMANKIMGHQPQNFALLMVEEGNGRIMNSQMTCHFENVDEFFSDLMSNDSGIVFDELGLDNLAELSVEQIQEDFENYCQGKFRFKFEGEND